MMMEALQFDPNRKQLKHIRQEIPEIIPHDYVLMKVYYAGICGTDIHIIHGEFPCNTSPFVLGHEFSGTVAKIGVNVTHVQIGDKIVADPNKGCMTCDQCRSAKPQYCRVGAFNSSLGIFKNGGWAQYCLIPKEQVHKIPESITLKQAVLCEPISCISHAFDRLAPIAIGQRILITGAGIIGNLFASLFHLLGHKYVTISEPNEYRLRITEKLGTNYKLIHPNALNNSNSEKFDLVVDCSGNEKVLEQTFSLLDYGGRLCVFGVPKPESLINLPAYRFMEKELSIIGILINPFSFPKALSLLESMSDRYLDYDQLGIKTYRLSEYETAIEHLKEGKIAKAMFQIQH